MKRILLISFALLSFYFSNAQSLNSINVLGNRFAADNSTQLFKTSDSKFLVFGSSANLGVLYADFEKGAGKQLFFMSENPDLEISDLEGAGGIAENDSTFVVIGQFELPEQNKQTIVIKATESGNIIWAKELSSNSNDIADKIIRCENGDYIISILSNQRENEFGVLISGSAVFRISSDGDLIWYLNLDDRLDSDSKVLTISELVSENIIITQNYSGKLSLTKLNADGDSISSVISDELINPTASDISFNNEFLAVSGRDNRLIFMDTSFSVIADKSYSETNLNNFSSVRFLNYSNNIAVGGNYQNKIAILNIRLSDFAVNEMFHHNYFPFAGANIQGLFVVEDTFYSLISNGFALTRHNQDLSSSCFSSINGNTISVSNSSSLTFNPNLLLQKETPDFDNLLGIYTEEKFVEQPSVNCVDYDLSLNTQFPAYDKSCRNIMLRWYVYNHGLTPVSSFKIKYYYNNFSKEQVFNLNSPLSTKTGSFIDFGELYLEPGDNIIRYIISEPDGQSDNYSFNDSFHTEFKTIQNVTVRLDAKDEICGKETNIFNTSAPDGTYSLFRNNNLLLQTQNKTMTSFSGGGAYFLMFEDSKGCAFYSDTFNVTENPLPDKPNLTVQNDTIFSDAIGKTDWYFNNEKVDSNVNFLKYRGEGNYRQVVKNEFGCISESDIKFWVMSVFEAPISEYFSITNNQFIWKNQSNGNIRIHSIDGKELYRFDNANYGSEYSINLQTGIYLISVESNGRTSFSKYLITE